MDFNKILKKYWWVAALLLMAIIGQFVPKEAPAPRNFIAEGTDLIKKLREPVSVESLTADYAAAAAFLSDIKAQKDSSDEFVYVELELEALVANKDKNIESEGRRLKIKKQFSEWDGSNIILTKAIKERMNNPDSYEHVSTDYSIDGNKISIYTTFRGKNAFNAVVLNEAYGVTDMDGNLLELKF